MLRTLYMVRECKEVMATWTSLHPSHWTTNEVSNWMAFVARQHGIDDETSARHIALFEDVRGDKLCSMSREDFQFLEPSFGDLYFDVFRKIFHECIPPSESHAGASVVQHHCKPEEESSSDLGSKTQRGCPKIQKSQSQAENRDQPKTEAK